MKLQEHADISPCSLAVFAAGHPWWWHMSNIYKYNLNSTLHISSDSLQIKVYYNLKRHLCKAYGKLRTISFLWADWRLHPSKKKKKNTTPAALRWGFTIVFFGYHDELCNFKKQVIKSIFGNPDICVLMKTRYALRSWACTEVHEYGKLWKWAR